MSFKEFGQTISKNQNAIIMAVLELVVGILLLVNPTQFTQVIFIVFGLFLIVRALGCAWRYFREPAAEAASTQTLAAGIIALAAGIFCVARTGWFVDTFPVMTVLYGVVILLTAAPKLQWTIDAARVHMKQWFMPAISALVAVVCGAVVVAGPLDEGALWTFAGVTLIVGAALDAVSIALIQHTIYRAANPKPAAPAPVETASADKAAKRARGDKSTPATSTPTDAQAHDEKVATPEDAESGETADGVRQDAAHPDAAAGLPQGTRAETDAAGFAGAAASPDAVASAPKTGASAEK